MATASAVTSVARAGAATVNATASTRVPRVLHYETSMMRADVIHSPLYTPAVRHP